ncbi:MAG: ABC transporter ATP-binding protein [Phycisphaeraceae bacterium]|nr:ABC transporter ATP-binding protein [Phycisphaeraceae bacterium]
MSQFGNSYVELDRLVKAYPNPRGEATRVVDGFSTKIAEGEFVSVIGHSGCGKSTVLTMLAGLNDVTSGNIILAGKEVSGAGPDRAVVFQSPCLLPWMSAFDNVMLGVKRCYPKATRLERKQLVEYFLSIVGLGDAMHKYPKELSGGMQQRVGIARAIALRPKMLLLDEPFGKLDSLTRMDLQETVLNLLNEHRITTMMITHDVDEAIFMSDRVVMMTNGPRAKVGQVLDIPFERPRNRVDVLGDEMYYDFRGCLIDFLEGQDRRKHGEPDASMPEPKPVTKPETVQDLMLVQSPAEVSAV